MVSNMNIQMSDECYTPTPVYETVKNWACAEYNIDPKRIVRPFYVGGDYEHFPYRPDSVVVDNPPFSLLSKLLWFAEIFPHEIISKGPLEAQWSFVLLCLIGITL